MGRGKLQPFHHQALVIVGGLLLCASLTTGCGSDEGPSQATAAQATGGQSTGEESETWPADVCIPYSGPNPPMEEARSLARQAMSAILPKGLSPEEVAANQAPEDYLDDMTRPTTYQGHHGHEFKYTEFAEGAMAYVSEMRCKGHEARLVEDYSVWGPNVNLGFSITSAMRECDDLKGGRRR